MAGQYRSVFGRSAGISDVQWDALQAQSWSYNSLNATNSLTITAKPLAAFERWAESSIAYATNLVLYRLTYDGIGPDAQPMYRSSPIGWDTDTIRQHQVQAKISFDSGEVQSLSLTAALPPRDQRYTGQLGIAVSPVAMTVGAGVTQLSDSSWKYDPLTATARLSLGDLGSVDNQLSYSLEASELTLNRTHGVVGPVSVLFEAQTTEDYVFLPLVGWQPGTARQFRPTRAEIGLNLRPGAGTYWQNRIKADFALDTSISANVLRFTESAFRLQFTGALEISEFMTLSVSTTSTNEQIYVYVPSLTAIVGRESRNIFLDLLRSFNFFNRSDRIASAFNIQQVQVKLTHDLGDWDLNVGYSGRPELVDDEVGGKVYQWRGTLDLTLQWRPIRELRTAISVDSDDITFSGNP
ncbi:MAG: hypothetical protein E4H09_04650 [Spirochaetales bacterium]|nr:MAG: hypothetical protein E4H09_04650 [Spirochaetales bacterium]